MVDLIFLFTYISRVAINESRLFLPSSIATSLNIFGQLHIFYWKLKPLMSYFRSERGFSTYSKFAEGSLIRVKSSKSIYLIEDGKRREFNSFQTFAKKGFDLDQVTNFKCTFFKVS